MEIFDTTSRDGSQAENVSFTVHDKLRIIEILDDYGVDFIELGWPFSNIKDKEAFEKASQLALKNAKIVAFGSTHRKSLNPEDDPNLQGIIESKAPVACIFGKTSKVHVELQLKTTPEKNLEIIKNSVTYLKKNGLTVFYDAEHFFDGYKEDEKYAIDCLKAAKEGGAERLILCDTNGGTLPDEVVEILKVVNKHFDKMVLGVHFHNDNGCAVANSVIASDYVNQIHGTINGFGERTGNADLCQVIPNLMLKKKLELNIKLKNTKKVSEMIYTLSNNKPFRRNPYVGDFSFSHKGGIHVDAITKGAPYEHINPEDVGNKRNIVLSDLSGKANLIEAGKNFGIDIQKDDPNIRAALKEIEELEKKGYDISTIKAEQYLLLLKHFRNRKSPINITQWKVMSEQRKGEFSEAMMVGEKGGTKYEVVSPVEGIGPVGATYKAMQKLFLQDFPSIKNIKLVNYKVRIAEDIGADSSVRVYVEFSQNGDLWATVGVSTNILEASVEAIKKGFDYYILKN